MSDIVRIYDENKVKQNGTYNRDNIPKNYYYFSVNVWIVFGKEKIMIQKRSENKKFYGNKYECVAGGVVGDETIIEACIRETKEETNLNISSKDLIFINEFLDKKHNYFMHTFVACLNETYINKIKINNDEVSEYKIVNFDEIIEKMNLNLFADSFNLRFPLYLKKFKKIVNTM